MIKTRPNQRHYDYLSLHRRDYGGVLIRLHKTHSRNLEIYKSVLHISRIETRAATGPEPNLNRVEKFIFNMLDVSI